MIIMNSTLTNLRKLRSKYHHNVKHLKNVRSLGNPRVILSTEQDSKLKEVEIQQREREVFFNNLSKALIKEGDKSEKVL